MEENQMEYTTHQEVDLSEIGIGLYALSGVYGRKDVKHVKRMLKKAYEAGVTLFDTAQAYGNAESILGETVHSFREDIFIATKVGIREGFTPDLSESMVRTACEESLQRLQTAYIDLYQVHFHDMNTPVAETVGALNDLVAEGKIRYYGVGHLPQDTAETYCKKGNIFSILMELSAVSRRALTTMLPLCKMYKAAGIAFSTTGRGILTGRYDSSTTFEPGDIRTIDPLFQREQFESALRVTQACTAIATRLGKTPVQVALAWVLEQPGIVCALTGPSTVSHMEENCGGSGWSLPEEDCATLEALFKREDAWLEKQQVHTIHLILSEPLAPDFLQAFTDLVYALETSITAGIAPEEKIMPLFQELFGTRKNKDEKKMGEIQQKMQDLLDDAVQGAAHS
ncbi:MAG: aldo/keto reductase [Theionarchaea archaeon]|nr:aldo/keto reductase [Theionarchaea archaeon]